MKRFLDFKRRELGTSDNGVRLFGFGLSGGIGTLIDFAVFNALLVGAELNFFIANLLSFACGSIFAFFLLRRFFYQNTVVGVSKSFALYFVFGAISVLSSSLAIAGIAQVSASLLWINVAKVAVVLGLFLLKFILSDKYAFARDR